MPFVFQLAPSKREFMFVLFCVVKVDSTNINNVYLHPKWQQTPVWEVPQGGGGYFFFFF